MTVNIDDIYFSSTAPDLKKRKIGVGADPFSAQYAMGMYDEDVTTPKIGYEVPRVEEKEQEIDVPGGAQALDTDLEEAAMLFTDEEKEKERKKLSKFVDPIGIGLHQVSKFSDEASKIRAEMPTTRGIGISSAPPASLAGQGAADLGELGEEGVGEVPLSGDMYMPETGLDTLLEKGTDYAWDKVGKPVWEAGKDVYYDYFGSKGTPGGWTGTGYGAAVTGGSAMLPYAPVAGAGRSAAQIAKGWGGTGFGALTGTQAGIYGGATQAGVQAGTQAGIYGGAQAGAGTGAQATTSGGSTLGSLAAIYGIYSGLQAGTNRGKMDAALSAAVLINPAMAVPVAVIQGLNTLFGMRRRGKPKFPFGGTEFKTEGNKLKFKHPYGYNGFNGGVARAGAASVADYVNTYVSHFSDLATGQGLNFNANAWKNAVKEDPRLERYDTMNDSGYADPSVLIRKIFETPVIITGTPVKNGVPITGQQQYEQAMGEFNQWYTKTAKDRGGLVNASWLNTQEEPNMFGENWAGGHGEVPTQIRHAHRGELTGHIGDIGGQVQGIPQYNWSYTHEDVTSPYDVLYYNITGKFNRGEGGMGY